MANKRKVFKLIKGFSFMIIGCALMIVLFSSAMNVLQRQDEIAVLEKYISQKNNLQKLLGQYSTVKNMSDTRQQIMGSFLKEYVSLEKEFETKDIPQCDDGLSLPTLK